MVLKTEWAKYKAGHFWTRLKWAWILFALLAIATLVFGHQEKPAEENLAGYEELKLLVTIRKELHYDELRAKVADLERRVKLLEESCDAGPSF